MDKSPVRASIALIYDQGLHCYYRIMLFYMTTYQWSIDEITAAFEKATIHFRLIPTFSPLRTNNWP